MTTYYNALRGQPVPTSEALGLLSVSDINHLNSENLSSDNEAVIYAEGHQQIFFQANSGTWRIRMGNMASNIFTVDATANTLEVEGHGYENGAGPFKVSSETTLPGGLDADDEYYIIPVDEDTFKLAATRADALATTPVPVDITTTGTGAHTITGMPDSATPEASVSGGGALVIDERGSWGQAMPTCLTVKGFGDGCILTYWMV